MPICGLLYEQGQRPVPPIAIEALRTQGNPLDWAVQAFFGPLLGHDLSRVRVHTDAKAAASAFSLNADAYTVGSQVFFGEGQYSPRTATGRSLLAHELFHAVRNEEQNQADCINRKIKTNNVSIDDYLMRKGIENYEREGAAYSHRGVCFPEREREIVYDLLSSERNFPVAGATAERAKNNLDRHVRARKGIAEQTSKRPYRWGVGPSSRMNPRYWQAQNGRWGARPGVSLVDASRDVFLNPSGFDYAMACQLAAGVTFVAGSGSAQYKQENTKPADWVPGDWGYIENGDYVEGRSEPGTDGENIIYIGGRQFWGHPQGNKTLEAWIGYVRSWNGNTGRPELAKWRKYTAVGLE